MVIQKSGFLKIFPYFRNTPEAPVDDILSSYKYASAQENLVLKEKGAEVSKFVLLLSGEKRVYKTSGIGREITLYEMGPDDICVLNVSCILSSTRLPANPASLTKVEFLLTPSSDFVGIMFKYKAMPSFVFSRINSGFVSMMSLIAEVSFEKMDERL